MKNVTPLQLLKIDEIKWFHHFDEETFGFNVSGSKGRPCKIEAEAWELDADLFKDKSVLDIGAFNGYFSFLAEKMGAKQVLATDQYCWGGVEKHLATLEDPTCSVHGVASPSKVVLDGKRGFDLAYGLIGSEIESKTIDALDISLETVGKFDVVLFLGVFYHLIDPILGIRRAAEAAGEVLVVETTYEDANKASVNDKALLELRPPRLMLGQTGDAGNYWSPNVRCLQVLLTEILGFKKLRFKLNAPNQGRLICFAYR